MEKDKVFKIGKAAIVGRPNVGKSSLLNSLVGHKVAIVSKKPQTTRSQIVAFIEDERGQIFFLDTPGFYSAKAGTGQYNALISRSVQEADVILYVVDHTRDWGQEEEKIWNLVVYQEKPVILVINKIDQTTPTFKQSYLDILALKVKKTVEVSALAEQHLKTLISYIYELLPAGERDNSVDYFPSPLLSQSSKEYLAEIVREKIFHSTGQEVPYQTRVRVLEVEEDEEKNRLKIVGEILVFDKRYKPMLIGSCGRKIKEIGQAVRKELQTATGKQVVVKLTVVSNK